MTKLLQFVAGFVVAILTAQPALAGLTCGTRTLNAPCAPTCAMMHHGAGADCQMPEHGAGSGCLLDCCRLGSPLAVSRSATGKKPRSNAMLSFLAPPPRVPMAGRILFAHVPAKLVACSPPLYILFQVFRI
ncbi:MAG: hypothetical protein ABSF53_20625 [Terracidiphilus sp.]